MAYRTQLRNAANKAHRSLDIRLNTWKAFDARKTRLAKLSNGGLLAALRFPTTEEMINFDLYPFAKDDPLIKKSLLKITT